MYEIESYKKEIEKYFSKIIHDYDFIFEFKNSHRIFLKSKKCIIRISTERYQSGISVALISPENENLSVALFRILEQQGLMGKKIFTDQEIAVSEAIKDEMEKSIYTCSIMLEKYCQEALNGSYFDKLQESGKNPI